MGQQASYPNAKNQRDREDFNHLDHEGDQCHNDGGTAEDEEQFEIVIHLHKAHNGKEGAEQGEHPDDEQCHREHGDEQSGRGVWVVDIVWLHIGDKVTDHLRDCREARGGRSSGAPETCSGAPVGDYPPSPLVMRFLGSVACA